MKHSGAIVYWGAAYPTLGNWIEETVYYKNSDKNRHDHHKRIRIFMPLLWS